MGDMVLIPEVVEAYAERNTDGESALLTELAEETRASVFELPA